jgi:hypothetical protein
LNVIKVLILFVVLIFKVATCGNDQYKLLLDAYKNNSLALLDSFCTNWKKEYTLIDSNKIRVDEKDYYEVFRNFYNPFSLSYYGESGITDTLYKGYKYVIIQSRTAKMCNRSKITCKEVINDECCIGEFRPYLNQKEVIPLIFTQRYNKILKSFLANSTVDSIICGFNKCNADDPESLKRLKFLRQRLPIEIGHWRTDWYFITGPEIFITIFGKDNSLLFNLLNCTGEAWFTKTNGKWNIDSCKITGME